MTQATGLDRQCHLFPFSGEDILTIRFFFGDISLTGVLSEAMPVEGHVACQERRMNGMHGISKRFRNSVLRHRRVEEVELGG